MQQTEATQILSKNTKLISKKENNVMKNIKRILALVIVATMLVAIAIIPASAAEARAVTCTCGGTYTYDHKIPLTDWTYYSQRACIHFQYDYDTRETRTVRKVYYCDECGDEYNTTATEYRWVCNGHG